MSVFGEPWGVLVVALLVLVGAAVAATVDALLYPATAPGLGHRVGRPVWETARLLRQQRRVTTTPDALLQAVGVAGPLVAAMLMMVVVPVGDHALTDLDVGVVWFNTLDISLWGLWWLAGWGPNSVWPLIGGYRFLNLALSYELPLMFALTTPATAAGSLNINRIVATQHDLWFIVQMPVAFVVFCGSVIAFSAWGPFNTPAGRDLGGGILNELAGVDRLLVTAGRYALLMVGSATATALFLGGGAGPLLAPWAWTLVKTVAVLTALLRLRRAWPVIPAHRLATFAWTIVLPATLLQVLAVAAAGVW